MAVQPPAPYPPPARARLRQCGLRRSLVLAHGNATHMPNTDVPIFDPDTFYSMHPGRSELPVRRRLGAFPHQQHRPDTYQYLCTIAGGEVADDW